MKYLKDYYLEILRRTKKSKEELILAYGLRALGVFMISLIGFMIMGLHYSFLKALLIGVCSFLPLIGQGIVLVPWSILRLFGGEWTIAGRLSLVYLLSLCIASIAEPYYIGTDKGIRPIIAFVLYLFFYFIGFVKGAVIAMCLIFIGKILLETVDIQNAHRRRKIRQSRETL
ncbi:MAG: AI-2E family transporter [Tissierellia bacterium]|nr:AI-2E family transporter [Tissierellia bacterium]